MAYSLEGENGNNKGSQMSVVFKWLVNRFDSDVMIVRRQLVYGGS